MKRGAPESPYAWARLFTSLVLMTIGNSGMYVVAVALPPVQAEFAVARADASLPYTLTMIGFALGGVLMGRLSDRFGVMLPVMASAAALGAGYALAGLAQAMWQFNLAQALLVGFFGGSATFAPLVADASLWFTRRRGVAVAIAISGNLLAGAVWPPIAQHFIDAAGWRATYLGLGVFSAATILPLALVLRLRPPLPGEAPAGAPGARAFSERPLGFAPNALLALLCLAALSCCVAMAMPMVHIVALCGDLGYAAARGAEMLALMFACGVASRLVYGFIADRIGGLRTLLLGASLQASALALFLPAQGLAALYVVSGLFGAFQGGLVPAYPIIVRELFAPRDAGARVAIVLMASTFGMGLGGWLAGALFDLTGSYRAAFVNALAWNALTIAIALWLLRREAPTPRPAPAAL